MKVLVTSTMILLTAIGIGAFAAVDNIQQANADNNNGNDEKKICNDRHSDSSTKCSQKDTTPFILPFP